MKHRLQVTRAVYDNFKGWCSTLIDVKRVNGLTLRDTLVRDKEKGIPMGGPYYDQLKAAFRDDTDPAASCTYERTSSKNILGDIPILFEHVCAYAETDDLIAFMLLSASLFSQRSLSDAWAHLLLNEAPTSNTL